jgi:peptidyl-prolyl cis-trans isomerase B (cyclophilin B)
MKYLFFIAFLTATLAARAEDAAVMTLKIGKEKKLERVWIGFYEGDAPETIANFKKLARHKFYNGLAVHRVFPHLLVQVGDPLSRKKDRRRVGTGGPGYTLSAEIHRRHLVGAVAMSRLPDKINPARRSSGSQFYICLKPMPNLDGQYTVFGKVLEGMDVLERISQLPADTNDNPIGRVVIRSLRIVPQS